ncbi:ATP-binding cassette domain-containing protein [Clostridium sp. MCC353]|uniref:sulfate/molybdate ABC transporter ATP-binding protein n=1 Tax=Clostridium sp. MCC353 TaxID=2592646 RepID=UPI001C030B46|nr:ATP-binding cassette domain-containing protein [Clostridium sp. MCC353]MBT9776475.1 ATP-binding cassette domain-containing protein [Clostridium sp. MCC353]
MSLQVDFEKKLKDITLRIAFETDENSGIHGILGASGCGKSMTLKCIAGILTPDRGRIVLNGRVLFDSEKKINLRVQDRKVGYLFQNYALFPNMTVRQNVEIGAAGHDSVKKKENAGRCMKLLQVEDLADNYPGRLSGGQQQRAALARILASEPDVLMLDEPFSALDYYLKESIQLDLLNILKEYEGDILMVTHSRDEIYRFCRNIHVLEQGNMVVSGKTKEVFANPQVVAAAKLTGCKNIVEAVPISNHEVEVPSWGTTLTFTEKVPEEIDHIGIRAHYFRKRTADDSVNVIPCRAKRLLEDPFEMTVILDNGIWWKIPKREWKEQYLEMLPKELVVPEESILFLKK